MSLSRATHITYTVDVTAEDFYLVSGK